MSEMTPRQRVLTAVSLKEPDRVPIDFGGTGATSIDLGAYNALKTHLDVDTETEFIYKRARVALPAQQILERFQVDTRRVIPKVSHYEVRAVDLDTEVFKDEWGVVMRKTSIGFYMHEQSPFDEHSSIEDIRRHQWPDPDDPARFAGLTESARALRATTDCAIILQVPSQVYSFGVALCGTEGWFVKLIKDPAFAEALIAKGMDLQIQMVVKMLDAVGDCVDIVGCSDDFASQRAPMLSPRLYRKIVKPHQKRLFDAIKQHSEAKIWCHTSGNVVDLIPDFIEMGLDILNPVQVSAADMDDTQRLKREFGSEIAFWGAIDTQRVLAFGTPEEVWEEVRRRIEDLAPGGGYVISSIQNIPDGTPPENVCAMFEAALEYGAY
jgi:uroporphyrinogen decarboxylase